MHTHGQTISAALAAVTLYKIREVMRKVGISKTTVYRLVSWDS